MSYTRTYHGSVTISGVEYASYPASEHGGTMSVPYSKTEPIEINIYVDTDPFDNSVVRTAGKVDFLTGAVAAMETAQVAAINSQAEQVSKHMIDGFYGLINSNLSTQKTECSTDVQSRFALLMSLSKAMQEKYERMEDDFTRQQRHYAKVFGDLDDTMVKRLKDIDLPVFQLEEEGRKKLILEPLTTSTAAGLDHIRTTGQTNDLLTTARLNKKITEILDSIKSYVVKITDYKGKVNHMLDPEQIREPERECIPAIVCGQRNLNEQNTEYRCYVPNMPAAQNVFNAVNEFAYNNSEPSWHPFSEEELSKVDQFFNQYVQESVQKESAENTAAERVHQEVMKLWQYHKNDMLNM